jgi:hypothetical protein
MRAKSKYAWMPLSAVLVAAGVAMAAEPAQRGGAGQEQGQSGMSGMMEGGMRHGGMMDGGMMHGGMMGGGMMDMMDGCRRMMQGTSHASPLPQLPPGNEKLQLQMHAEMMQKMGEILSKYAAKVVEPARTSR